MDTGPAGLVGRGLAVDQDIAHTEALGRLENARPDYVSTRALDRGYDQCGSLGSGNHFLGSSGRRPGLRSAGGGSHGIGRRDGLCDDPFRIARAGLSSLRRRAAQSARRTRKNMVSNFLTASLPVLRSKAPREKHYLGAMRAAANFAWCNRQLLMWQAREVFSSIFSHGWEELGMRLVYDVAHNIAKFEDHAWDDQQRRVWVHRKGATRAFPAGHPEVPPMYAKVGQPVIIPGDMGRASWVLVGQPGSMQRAFGSACHGAGRVLSRKAATRLAHGRDIHRELEERGVFARGRSWKGLAEEQPDAYKDVDLVVEVVHNANLAKKVARMKPIGVIKG